MVRKMKNPKVAAPLFEGWDEAIIWSCLQGVMGEVYVIGDGTCDEEDKTPKSAMTILGDFCTLAGVPNLELLMHRPEWSTNDWILMIPQNEGWEELIEKQYGDRAKRIFRYAIKKEPDVFQQEKLLAIIDNLPKEFTLHSIDESFYNQCMEEEWSRDLVSQFIDYTSFEKLGLGVVACCDGKVVAGASTYARYRDGIEIEIDTKEEFRERGLASACGARLILNCLAKNLYPSWDAHDLRSVALAQKLGYHLDKEYVTYEVFRG